MDVRRVKNGNSSIVLIDDNRNLRESWSTIISFERDLKVIGVFSCVEDALKSEELDQADIVLLDIEMPGMSGVQGVPKILDKNPSLSIVMATVHEDSASIFEALKNGAVGYLSKRVSTTELIQALRETIRGGSPMSPTVARKVIQSFQEIPAKKKDDATLSPRELEILQHLADGKSYATIAKTVFLSFDGVSYHVRNIYRKFQVKSRGEAVSEGMRRRLIRFLR